MDFSTKFTVRTDLADEALENLGGKKGDLGDGIGFETEYIRSVRVDNVTVKNETAERITGKPIGKYVTVTTGEIWKTDKETFENIAKTIADIVKGMLPEEKGLCLVAALGNDKITADAIGPLAADNLIVSRHIKIKSRDLYDSLGLGECACITPGVMGDTGAEALELVKGAVDALKPSCVVVIDALASRNVERLAKTVQICDSGISPGSGVGNARQEISKNTLGVPTVAIGVPTVVEVQTLCLDVLSGVLENEREVLDYVEKKMPQNVGRFFVCPKETDKIIKSMSKLVGYSLNFVLHKDMTLSEMDEFLA
ncbi:MAG: GPR endopeptidase [Clostridia bacterium]|nr:GPR endopeptidase [Clostridia bacterium]